MLARVRVQADTSEAGRSASALRRELATQVLAALRAPDTRADEARRDSLRGEIRRRELGVSANATATDSLSVTGVSARLGSDGVLVSYTRFGLFDLADAKNLGWQPREWYAALVLRGGESVPVAIELGPAGAIDQAVNQYRSSVLTFGESPEVHATGARLRKLVWDPVVRALDGRTQVYVVPDGELQKLNWYALPSEGDGFVVDEPRVIHRLAGERDLLTPAASRGGDGVLALGGMDYGAAAASGPVAAQSATAAPKRLLPSCRSFVDERFAALPASLGEARTVARLGRGFTRDTTRVTLLTGGEAGEAAFKRLAPGRRVVHLATHAFVLGAECADGEWADVLASNPLVFSGIALAGANGWRDAAAGGEDGLLTAEELAGMKLDGVEWLVLSGCESGMGQVQAWEGVYGLPRAARMAGVRTLIVSLLPVDDDASRLFMQALYTARFTQHEPTALAIRTASRKTLAWLRTNHRPLDPRLWAAFVAVGE